MEELNIKSKIHYNPICERYGKAEFTICPVFKYGYMRKLFIYRRQQPDEEEQEYFLDVRKELPTWKINVFQISAWVHKTDRPSIWRNFWCKDHKTIAFEVYVPNDTSAIEFDPHFGNTLDIRFVPKEMSE